MRRLLVLLVPALLLAGCTKGSTGLTFESATLEEPDFSLEPESGDRDTVFKVSAGKLGDKYNLTWDWGDGVTTYGASSEHKYGFTNGLMSITLFVSDDAGNQGLASKTIKLGSGNNKVPTVTLRAQKAWVEVGASVNLTASGSDGDRDPLSYLWSWTGGAAPGQTVFEGTGNRAKTSFAEPGEYVVKVRARDPKGGEAIANVTIDVSSKIPPSLFTQTWIGNLTAGTGGAAVSEKAWAVPGAPDTNADAARHRYRIDYPATTTIFLSWNDTSQQGAFDLDLELRAANGTTVFKSETRAPAAPFEFNFTAQEPGDYDVIVRAIAGANVMYTVFLQSQLKITPELVARAEGGS